MLNTPAAFLAVLVLVVAVNCFLFFSFYLPRTTTPLASPPPVERADPSSTVLEKTRPTTDKEETTTLTTKSPTKPPDKAPERSPDKAPERSPDNTPTESSPTATATASATAAP